MNLSLQAEDLEEGEDRFEMARKEPANVSSRSEVPDIPDGRFRRGNDLAPCRKFKEIESSLKA